MKTRQEKLLDGLDLLTLVGAEIGPLHKPLVSKESGHVIYVDHCDAEQLRAHYANDKGVNVEAIAVDAIWGAHTLQEAIASYFEGRGSKTQALDYVVASHVIEHVPDLVTWLQEIRSVLKSTGQVRLAVPDKRYTFDYLRRTTDLTDVMVAYVSKARIPNTQCLLDFCLNEVPIDTVSAWQGTVDTASLKKAHTLQGALSVARDALQNGTYHDVHCWVFTPASFAELFLELSRNGLVDFACIDFYDTLTNDSEFIVNLRICDDALEREISWKRMASLAQATPAAQASAVAVEERDPVASA